MRLSIDAMSGDAGLEMTIPASVKALQLWKDISIVLVGDKTRIEKKLSQYSGFDQSRLECIHATEIIEMGESPLQALRYKKQSSMRVAIDQVEKNQSSACLSAGNTGALMAISKFVLKMIDNVERPAICTALPSQKGWVYALDLGANVEVTAKHLFQFAVMGSAMVEAIENITEPSIGLMNVGSEEMKGTKITQEAHRLLSDSKTLNYQGFVEGNDLFTGSADVIVMGGVEGNIALKTSEGLARYVQTIAETHFKKNMFSRLLAAINYPILKKIKAQLNPSRYNGACLLGLKGIVVKSHGNSTADGFVQAISMTRKLTQHNLPKKIESLTR